VDGVAVIYIVPSMGGLAEVVEEGGYFGKLVIAQGAEDGNLPHALQDLHSLLSCRLFMGRPPHRHRRSALAHTQEAQEEVLGTHAGTRSPVRLLAGELQGSLGGGGVDRAPASGPRCASGRARCALWRRWYSPGEDERIEHRADPPGPVRPARRRRAPQVFAELALGHRAGPPSGPRLVQLQDRFWVMSSSATCESAEWNGEAFRRCS
jgi:hypothetical protein